MGCGCDKLFAHSAHAVRTTGLWCYGMSEMEAYEAAFIDMETGDPSLVEYDRAGDPRHMDDEHFASSNSEREMTRGR